MGLDFKVVCPPATQPSWHRLTTFLREQGLSATLRMIDGQLAFPDEAPSEDWRELRVSLSGGMVTVRRNVVGFELVIWGNADAALLAAWRTLAWAIAELSGGVVETDNGSQNACQFRQSSAMIDFDRKGETS